MRSSVRRAAGGFGRRGELQQHRGPDGSSATASGTALLVAGRPATTKFFKAGRPPPMVLAP